MTQVASTLAVAVRVRDAEAEVGKTLRSLAPPPGWRISVTLYGDGVTPSEARLLAAAGVGTVVFGNVRGAPACFNHLVRAGCSDVYLLVEAGAVAGVGCLARVLMALEADPRNGIAGPSTDHAWNAQGAFPDAAKDLDHWTRVAAERFGDEGQAPVPPWSLSDFFYAVRRRVFEAVGDADEGYGPGPCWEMDYSRRAERAGFRAVWVAGGLALRGTIGRRRQRDEALLFRRNQSRYRDGSSALAAHHEAADPAPAIIRPLVAAQRQPPPVEPDVTLPLVSCLMPTRDRRRFVPRAIRCFLAQDYPERELVIVDDGLDAVADLVPTDPRIRYVRAARFAALGEKRNYACDQARGHLLAHWDDDDWSAAHRLRVQVQILRGSGAAFCGLASLYFYEPARRLCWRYSYPNQAGRWVAGGTLCYTREFWQRRRFPSVQVGEDTHFVRQGRAGECAVVDDLSLYVATIHAGNTSKKVTAGRVWHQSSLAELQAHVGFDFDDFDGP